VIIRLLCIVTLLSLALPGCAARNAGLAPPGPTVLTTIGTSRQGRPIEAITLGRGQTRIYLIGSIHGDEPEGRSALDEVRRVLEAGAVESGGNGVGGGTSVRFVPDMNPDGSLAGSRTNSAGVDLNRNWPAANFKPAKGRGSSPLCEPESAAVYADIVRFDPHVIMVLHSARGGPFVNFDGPAAAATLADRFAAAARAAGDPRWKVVAEMGYPTPGSMGSYFGDDRGIPILTVELRRGDNLAMVAGPLAAGVSAVTAIGDVALVPMSRVQPEARVSNVPSIAGPPSATGGGSERSR